MNRRKLRVLQLGKQYYPHIGGIEVTMQQIAEGIQGEVDSFVLAAQERGGARKEIINNVPVYYAKSWGIIASMPISIDLIGYLRKHRDDYDIIHLHMPFPLGDLACLLSGFKGKLVLYWHSDIIRQKKLMLLYRPLMQWTLRRADVIAIATQGNIDGSPYVKLFERKCVKIPFGLRREWEEKSNRYWAERRQQEENLSGEILTKKSLSGEIDRKETLKLLFIGRLVYYKGCEVLVEAMELLGRRNQLNGIELCLVGAGVLEEELKARVHRNGLKEYIKFAGRVSDDVLEEKIRECDVFVFPSVANSEAFGLVQLETMAFGKPVINTSLSTGVPWVSIGGKTGLTVDPNDAKALADAILWMKEHPAEREEMGIQARRRVKKEFNQEKLLRKMIWLYRKLCAGEQNAK